VIEVTSNADAFSAQIEAALAEIDQQINTGYWSWSMRVFQDLVESTPQWSGNLAANWFYSLNSPSGDYDPVLGKADAWGKPGENSFEPFQRGAPMAVMMSIGRAMEGPRPTYNDRIFFSNNTPLSFAELASPEVAEDTKQDWRRVRPVNLVERKVALSEFMSFKWSNLPYDAAVYSYY
jgi:hypothetical protein